MPVYVNKIFNNGTESEKKCFHYCLWKNANAEDESQGAFTRMGPEYPKIFILCEPESGIQVVLTNRQGRTRSQKCLSTIGGGAKLSLTPWQVECIFIPKLGLQRNKSSSRYLFMFIWQPLPNSGPKHKYPCLHRHHLTIKHPRMTITASRRKLKAH